MGGQRCSSGDEGAADATVMLASTDGLVEALTTMTRRVRRMSAQVADAATDSSVRTEHLATLIEAVNALGRACSGVEVSTLAAFARRDDVDDIDAADDASLSFGRVRRQQVRGSGFVHDDAGLEVAHLLAVSEGSGSTRVNRAAELTSRMPLTLAAVTEGRIEIWQAHQILDECRLLDDQEAGEVDEWLHGRLGRIEPTRLRATARYAVGRVRPEKVRSRAATARLGRTLEVCPSAEPGLAQLYALIPSHHAAAIWEAASTLAKDYQGLDPALTADQARADAFVDLILADVDVRASVTLGIPVVTSAVSGVGEAHTPRRDPTEGKAPEDLTAEDLDFLFGPEPPPSSEPDRNIPERAHPPDPNIQHPPYPNNQHPPITQPPYPNNQHPPDPPITQPPYPDPHYDGPGVAPDRIPDWVLDQRDPGEMSAPIHGAGPLAGAFTSGVTVPRVGHIPADVVAVLLARLDLAVSRALIDSETGTVLETTTDAYTPPRRLRDFVVVRDGQCRMYGCTRPASSCDLDHATPHDQGGPTSPQNLAGLCRHHHRAKQSRQWTYRLDPDTGTATWVSTRTGTIRQTQPATSLAAFAMQLRHGVPLVALTPEAPARTAEPPPF